MLLCYFFCLFLHCFLYFDCPSKFLLTFFQATDRLHQQTVALKKIFDAFQNPTDAQRTYREIVLLQQLSDHDNIIKLFDVHKVLKRPWILNPL